MNLAQQAAGSALSSGAKNVEMCIAYLLLSLHHPTAMRWEEERGGLYLGIAVR